MGALLLSLIVAHRRRILDVILLGGIAVASLLMLAFLPLAAACSLWALVVVVYVVHACTHDVGDDGDRG